MEAALAEFNALRQEVVGIRQAQGAIVGLGITALGLLLTFGLQTDGDERLLLAVPWAALLVCLLHTAESWQLHRLGDYIRLRTWPFIQAASSYPHSWEAEHSVPVKGWGSIVRAGLFDGATCILFASTGLAALILSSPSGWETWVPGGAAILATLCLPLVFAISLTRARKRSRETDPAVD